MTVDNNDADIEVLDTCCVRNSLLSCNVSVCFFSCLTDNRNLIIYISIAVAAAVVMVMAAVLIFIIIRRASSTAIAGPLVSASPVAVSNRPPAKHNGFAPALLRFHGYRGHYNNGCYSYECFAHNSRCLHSRINVYSAIQSRRSIELAWRQLFGKYKI